MGFLMVIVLSFVYILVEPKTASAATFDVTSYGAIGDGNTYDTKAFVKAWGDLCGDTAADPTLIVPSGKTFLIQCMSFIGPCKSASVHIKIFGNITAPKSRDGWKGCGTKYFMYFRSVQGLIMEGPGQIDGQGSIWWPLAVVTPDGPTCDNCPTMLRFERCDGLQLGGTRESGDDCVAIDGGTDYINVTGVSCGPGHGISIGSLGKNGSYSTVKHVQMRNCNITGTSNGVRIKTVPNGKGYARSIVFEDIYLINFKNPIIIDQHYCNDMEDPSCPAPATASSVKVSDVTYRNIHGTSAAKQAITFNCLEKCTGIVTNEVGITGEDVYAYCQNVRGEFTNTNPQISCN